MTQAEAGPMIATEAAGQQVSLAPVAEALLGLPPVDSSHLDGYTAPAKGSMSHGIDVRNPKKTPDPNGLPIRSNLNPFRPLNPDMAVRTATYSREEIRAKIDRDRTQNGRMPWRAISDTEFDKSFPLDEFTEKK
jgi:hypothetical protein